MATGAVRAVKIVYRATFGDERPFNREFEGIKKFEEVSRSHPSQLAIFHVGRNDAAGCFYYVMELADSVDAERRMQTAESTLIRPPDTFSPVGEKDGMRGRVHRPARITLNPAFGMGRGSQKPTMDTDFRKRCPFTPPVIHWFSVSVWYPCPSVCIRG